MDSAPSARSGPVRVLLARLALVLCALSFTQSASAQRRVLVYDPAGRSSASTLLADAALNAPTNPARPVFTYASDAMWRSMTTADFARYNAIWMDGGTCATPSDRGAAMFRAASDTRLTWSSAITSNFEIIGSDQDLHRSHPGARKFILNSYHYVTSGAGTGLFVSTSCLFYTAPADTPVPWLQGIGDFRVTGDGCTDGQMLEPFGATHLVHRGIAPPGTTINLPSDLAWGCFTHSHFNRHPPSFNRVYSIGGLGPGRGVVIVNDRGGCVIDADCLPGQFCNRDPAGGDPTCRTTRGNGRECTTNADCTSGVCTEGVCCDRRCDGQCESCRNAGRVGLCSATTGAPVSPRPACTGLGTTCGGRCDGTVRDRCTFPAGETTCAAAACVDGRATTASVCDGMGNCPPGTATVCDPYACGPTGCLTRCTTNADCAAGRLCREGMCVTGRPPGAACTMASECASGHCVDGVCCNTACGGRCEACDVPGSAGACTAVRGDPRGMRPACGGTATCAGTCDGVRRDGCSFPGLETRCRSPSCDMGRETLPAFCDGMGNCPAAETRACSPTVCGPTACLPMCSTDADCATGFYCDRGRCAPRQPPGSACTTNSECASGFCVDGLCCNTACNGQCEACDVAGSVGNCAPTRGAPRGSRPACAGTGACAGACDGMVRDACVYPGSSSTCSEVSCRDAVATAAGVCDGRGACGAGATTPCGAYVCDGPRCRTNCSASTHCTAGHFCDELGRCRPVPELGRPCATTADCRQGVCSDGVCCDRACDGVCETCRARDQVGTCLPLPRGAAPEPGDAGVPPNCAVCDGMRNCEARDAGVMPADTGIDAGPPTTATDAGGCGCRTSSSSSGSRGAAALALALAALLARRRRAHAPR